MLPAHGARQDILLGKAATFRDFGDAQMRMPQQVARFVKAEAEDEIPR